jgi:DNA-binding MarR family transcriptional regulator
MTPQPTIALVAILHDLIVALCRREAADLTARQFAVFLTCYRIQGSHTVRGLAAHLNVHKPAITRAMKKLVELDLICRADDPSDGRSVLAMRTLKGTAFFLEITEIMGLSSEAQSSRQTTNAT